MPIIPNINVPPLVHTPKVCSRTHSLLAYLRLPGLVRSERLRADIRILTKFSEHKIDESLQLVSQDGRLAAFIAHIKKSVDEKPHVLVAYAWVLYMALFSGGRYLRALLQGAGDLGHEFWERDPSPIRPYSVTGDRDEFRGWGPAEFAEQLNISARSRSRIRSEDSPSESIPGMQFFSFPGNEDGEDIKLEFKKRMTETEILLTAGEKEDIITEAEAIFQFMVEMVSELDKVMKIDEEDLQTEQKATTPNNSRDSIVVTQERLSKKVRNLAEISRIEDSTLVDLLVTGPMAKIVQFGEMALKNAEDSSSGRCKKHGESSRNCKHVSFSPTPNDDPTLGSVWIYALTAILPILAVLAFFLLWYTTH